MGFYVLFNWYIELILLYLLWIDLNFEYGIYEDNGNVKKNLWGIWIFYLIWYFLVRNWNNLIVIIFFILV